MRVCIHSVAHSMYKLFFLISFWHFFYFDILFSYECIKILLQKKEDLFKICISCLFFFCDQIVALSPTECVDLAVCAGERTGKELFYYEASEPSQTSPGAFCFFSWCLPKKKRIYII